MGLSSRPRLLAQELANTRYQLVDALVRLAEAPIGFTETRIGFGIACGGFQDKTVHLDGDSVYAVRQLVELALRVSPPLAGFLAIFAALLRESRSHVLDTFKPLLSRHRASVPILLCLTVAARCSLQGPISIARAGPKLRPIFYRHPDRMKLPRFAALRLEAENVLAMHLFADELNGLLQSVLLQEIQSSPAGGLSEQAGKIRLLQPI